MAQTRINLLPWREEQRKRQNIEFYIVIGAVAVVALLIALGVSMYYQSGIDFQNERNQYLNSEISILNDKIKKIRELENEKEALLARMRVIQDRQSSRPEVVHLFESLVEMLPDGVWLANVTQNGSNLDVNGYAESNARVSALMRNIDDAVWLKDPRLITITAPGGGNASFTMKLQQDSPDASKDKN